MKVGVLLAALLPLAAVLHAQQQTDKHFSVLPTSPVAIHIELADSIRIERWSKPEVWVEATASINHNTQMSNYVVTIDPQPDTLQVEAVYNDPAQKDVPIT